MDTGGMYLAENYLKNDDVDEDSPALRMIWVIGRIGILDEIRDWRWEEMFWREKERETLREET